MSRTALALAVLTAFVLAGLPGAGADPKAIPPFAYVTDHFTGTISIIDTASNKVIGKVRVGDLPFGIAVTPDGALAYITNSASTSNSVSVIYHKENREHKVIATIPVGSQPTGVGMTPDVASVYVANTASNSVSVIDTGTNTVSTVVGVGTSPLGLAVTPDGSRVYVANVGDGTVSVIDTRTNTAAPAVAVGAFPFGVAATPDGTRVYVTNITSATVTVLSTATNSPIGVVPVGSFPFAAAASPDSQRVYVTNFNDNTVTVIFTPTNTPVAAVPVGSQPTAVSVTPDGSRVFVANSGDNTISIIDTATNAVVASVSVDASHYGQGTLIRPFIPGLTPFESFTADADLRVQQGTFRLHGKFTVPRGGSGGCSGVDPVNNPVTIKVGPFKTTIPPGSFQRRTGDQDCNGDDAWVFFGTSPDNPGAALKVTIIPHPDGRFDIHIEATGANLTGASNPVLVRLTIGRQGQSTGFTSTAADTNGVKP